MYSYKTDKITTVVLTTLCRKKSKIAWGEILLTPGKYLTKSLPSTPTINRNHRCTFEKFIRTDYFLARIVCFMVLEEITSEFPVCLPLFQTAPAKRRQMRSVRTCKVKGY